MQNEQIQPVLDYLDKIATKIGSTAEQVWPWLVRQQYVEALYGGVLFLLFTIGLVFSIYGAIKIDWDEGHLEMTLAAAVQHIEDNGLEDELSQRVVEKWNAIEESISCKDRKRRY